MAIVSRRSLLLVTALMLGATEAAAQDAAPAKPVIETPDWLRTPNFEELRRSLPAKARRSRIDGAAVIQCGILSNGRLGFCTVVSESPADLGFGEGALRSASFFRMKPRTSAGTPVAGGTVRIPIFFRTSLY